MKKHLPPELDPAQPDAALVPTHEVGEATGKHPGREQEDPEIEPGTGNAKP